MYMVIHCSNSANGSRSILSLASTTLPFSFTIHYHSWSTIIIRYIRYEWDSDIINLIDYDSLSTDSDSFLFIIIHYPLTLLHLIIIDPQASFTMN